MALHIIVFIRVAQEHIYVNYPCYRVIYFKYETNNIILIIWSILTNGQNVFSKKKDLEDELMRISKKLSNIVLPVGICYKFIYCMKK